MALAARHRCLCCYRPRRSRIFGRSERTLRNWVRAGHLRPVRVGRSVFFRADDIHALLDAR